MKKSVPFTSHRRHNNQHLHHISTDCNQDIESVERLFNNNNNQDADKSCNICSKTAISDINSNNNNYQPHHRLSFPIDADNDNQDAERSDALIRRASLDKKLTPDAKSSLERFIKVTNCIRRSQSMSTMRRSHFSVPRYRSGSSSDSAITLDNVFEDDDDAKIPLSPSSDASQLSKSWTPFRVETRASVADADACDLKLASAVCNHGNNDLFDDFNDVIFNCVCFILENAKDKKFDILNSVNIDKIMITIKRHHVHHYLDNDNKISDKIIVADNGRRENKTERPKDSKIEKINETSSSDKFKEAAKLASKIKYLETVLSDILRHKSTKVWSTNRTPRMSSSLSYEDLYIGRHFETIDQMKILAREAGIPSELRPKLWFSLISNRINDNIDANDLLSAARITAKLYNNCDKNLRIGDANHNEDADLDAKTFERSEAIESIIRQIDLDVHRTYPGHDMFASDDGIDKLRLILIAYSVHVNPMIGYCQAMNFIAALFLIIFNGNETQSLMALITIIDHYFPPHYYDHQLTGARADQLLLRDIILSRLSSKRSLLLSNRMSVRNYKSSVCQKNRTASTISLPTATATTTTFKSASDQTNEQLIDEITNSLTLNWFLSLFHHALPLQSNAENLPPQIYPQVVRLVTKQIQDLVQNPLEGVRVIVNEEDITIVNAIIDGPAGTPYESGSFNVRLILGKEFPSAPPKAFFTTKIFHPNVSREGEICVNTLKKDWKSDLGLKHVLLTIKCLLIVPNPESALNEEAGKLLLEKYDDYCRRARMVTEIHAIKRSTNCGNDPSASNPLDRPSTSRTRDEETSEPLQKKVAKGSKSTGSNMSNAMKDKRRTLKRL